MENYKKKYEDALAKARQLIFDGDKQVVRDTISYIFPELQESEDKKIMKEIAEFIYNSAFKPKDIKKKEKWLAWFEKQGEQKPVMEGTFVNVNEVRDDFMQEVYRVLDADSTNDRANQIIDAFDNLPTVTIEKQGEQNPIDKVEPKFHEGEWVVFNNRHQSIYQVEKIENGYYILRHTHGVYPATKEQRDTLTKAMKDAGYEFDFMKKELKEIAKPNFNVGDTIVPKHNPTTNKIYFTITDITGGKYWYNDRIICDIAEQDEWELLEQKFAWSEEDEKLYQDALDAFEALDNDLDPLEDWGRLYNWLKSLKQRMEE